MIALFAEHLSNGSESLITLQDTNQADDTGRSYVVKPDKAKQVRQISCARSHEGIGLCKIQLKNKFKKGEKVWMKNLSTGHFQWSMTVVDVMYDERRRGWNYQVEDEEGVQYNGGESGWVVEGVLKD